MNNNITEDYCSFEVSKLLKEKGFNVSYSNRWFDEDRVPLFWDDIELDDRLKLIAAPTHALAIKFIRENFRPNFSINIFPYIYRNKTLYEVRIFGHHFTESQFKKPELGIDSALLYTLKNLI